MSETPDRHEVDRQQSLYPQTDGLPSPRVLKDIEAGIHHMDHGQVGDEFEIDDVEELLNEP